MPGKPSNSDVSENLVENAERTLRSTAVPYDWDLCHICQNHGGVCRKVMLLETGQSMLRVAEKLVDKSFFLRLNTIPSANDAVANEVKYHLKCWSSCKQLAGKAESFSLPGDESFATVISDIEMINIIETKLNDPSNIVIDMNSINTTYKNLLLDNGMEESDVKPNYK